jgi:uncharacterized membrane protein YcfT
MIAVAKNYTERTELRSNNVNAILYLFIVSYLIITVAGFFGIETAEKT